MPTKAIKEDDRIPDEMKIRMGACMPGTHLMQPFLEAGDHPSHQEGALLPWAAFALPSRPPGEMRENLLIPIAKVNMNTASRQKADRGHALKNMLPGPGEWPGLQCNAQPRVSNGDELVISSDLGSIIFCRKCESSSH